MTRRRPALPFLAAMIGCGLALLAGPVPAARAQTQLVSATPPPGSTLSLPPPEVRLVFDHPLLAEGTTIHVTDADRVAVDTGNWQIDPANPFALVVRLPLLYEGDYAVSYTAATVGTSTILTGSYNFTIHLPAPILNVAEPTNGQSFPPGSVPLRLEAQFIDFNVYDTRVRLYVDGKLYREWVGLRANIEGLGMGVHEIRTTLVRLGEEVPDTSTTIYIAIKRPDTAAAGTTLQPSPPDVMRLPAEQLAALIGLIVVLIGAGYWLGLRSG